MIKKWKNYILFQKEYELKKSLFFLENQIKKSIYDKYRASLLFLNKCLNGVFKNVKKSHFQKLLHFQIKNNKHNLRRLSLNSSFYNETQFQDKIRGRMKKMTYIDSEYNNKKCLQGKSYF